MQSGIKHTEEYEVSCLNTQQISVLSNIYSCVSVWSTNKTNTTSHRWLLYSTFHENLSERSK